MTAMTIAARKSPVRRATVARISSRITSGLIKACPSKTEPRVPLLLGDHVGAVFLQPLLHLLLGQT